MSRLPPAPDLAWEDDRPRARAFDDFYFSRAGGLDEADAVFLQGCGLPDAWRAAPRFSILELGFGAGLNTLATWRLWRRTRAPGAILHFVSIEAFPMARADAARVHAAFPELAALSAKLCARWPARAYAPQRLWFAEDGFALTVLHGEAGVVLDDVVGAFDAFFLDGFAPARNPAMWSPRVAARLAALAQPNARAASYSVAGDVRRALAEAGFSVEKKPGFAGKRERLEARIVAPPAQSHPLYPYSERAPRSVAIVGGGIAGASMARALARRGVGVTLFERAAALASGASGNDAALVMPRLDRGQGPVQQLFLAGFLDAVDAYRDDDLYAACGAVETDRADLIADPPLAPDWLALQSADAVLHLQAGLVRPRDVIARWTRDAEVRLSAEIAAIASSPHGVTLRAADGAALGVFDAVVLANGARLSGFASTEWLTLRRTAGQVERADLSGAALAHARVGDSYVAPLDDGVVFGATFERIEANEAEASQQARAANLAALRALAPDIADRIGPAHSRASVRAAAPDYAPLAGLLPDAQSWLSRHAGIAQGRPPDVSKRAPETAGVYCLGGLSARGFALAPLLAERIASEMFLEPQAPSRAVIEAAHPARFLHRMLKKGLTMPASVKSDDAHSS